MQARWHLTVARALSSGSEGGSVAREKHDSLPLPEPDSVSDCELPLAVARTARGTRNSNCITVHCWKPCIG